MDGEDSFASTVKHVDVDRVSGTVGQDEDAKRLDSELVVHSTSDHRALDSRAAQSLSPDKL